MTRRRSLRASFSFARIFVPIGLSAALAACSMGQGPAVDTAAHFDPPRSVKGDLGIAWLFREKRKIERTDPVAAVAYGFRVVEEADPTVAAVPDPAVLERHAQMIRRGGRYHVGKPYEVAGKLYEPRENPSYDRTGLASWYGASFHGRLTANGEIFDRTAITAAHPTMPLPSYVRITNLNNDRSIMVRVNDRGPFKYDRMIDVSEQTAAILGFRRNGLTRVRVQYVSKAPLAGDDKSWLLATYQGPPAGRPGVVLAAAEPVRPMAANSFAFTSERKRQPAEAAIDKLTTSMSASERIQMALLAASEAEE